MSVLTIRGFLAATVEEIAHLHLLREALDRVSNSEELVAALTPSGFVDDEDAARWSMSTAEFAAAVTRLPEIATAAVAAQRRHEEQLVALLEQHCRRLRIRPALPLPQVVVMLGGLGTSLALRRGVDPATDVAAIMANVLAIVAYETFGSRKGVPYYWSRAAWHRCWAGPRISARPWWSEVSTSPVSTIETPASPRAPRPGTPWRRWPRTAWPSSTRWAGLVRTS